MLTGQAVADDVVSVDQEGGVNRVSAIIDQTSNIVVCSPEPGVVDDDVAAFNLYHVCGLHASAGVHASNSSVDISNEAWVGAASGVAR